MKDYYKVLGVSPQADEKEIKTAYRKLAKKYHPDAVRDNPELAERMYVIQAAYEVLGDEEKRKQYDESLKAGPARQKRAGQAGGNPFGSNPFGSGPFGNNPFQNGADNNRSAEQKNAENGNPNPDMSQFERFFGFQAGKGMETYQDKRAGAKKADGPINPEDLFAAYFGKKK